VTTLAARIGLVNERWLVYLKVGGGWVHNTVSLTNFTTDASASTSDTSGGFLVGGVSNTLSRPIGPRERSTAS
jgi:hypothetical protein